MVDDRSPQAERLLDMHMEAERGIFAVAQLDDAGDAHKINACPEVEAADDRRAREDQHREVLVGLDERMRDRPAAAEVAESEGVVAVDQHAFMAQVLFHPALSL